MIGAVVEQERIMYRFTRHSDGSYVVTVPAGAGSWRLLDGCISTHAGGRVVCVDMHEPVDLVALQQAWSTWWLAEYGIANVASHM